MNEPAAPRRLPALNGTQLKLIACISMLIDHIGASCLENGRLIWMAANIYTVDRVLRYIGRLAFPIYCFLIAEGFLHTRDRVKYAVRLGVFALISELPFNAAFFTGWLYPYYQNVYFTLLLGLLAIWAMDATAKVLAGQPAWLRVVLQWLIAAPFAVVAEWLHTDYGWIGVVMIALFWFFREKLLWRDGTVFALTALKDPPGFLALLPLRLYNGERGRCPAWAKYAFYFFYPAHLTLLALFTQLVLRR